MPDESQKVIERLEKLETDVADLHLKVNIILGQATSIDKILKMVVLPLLLIVGGLVGVKLAVP